MAEATSFRSYTSGSRGLAGSVRELRDLVRHHRRDVPGRVRAEVAQLRAVEASVEERLGIELEDRRMLDLGAGQGLFQLMYFTARGNDVVGIDRDLIVHGFDPLGYVRMARTNGPKRAAKTIARKSLGIDRAYRRALEEELNVSRTRRRLGAGQMDAAAMSFPDASFDFAYSFRVFMHLDRPHLVAQEAARVIAPGGGAYIAFLPYTAMNGCLDLRMLSGQGDGLPPWLHLRPKHAADVRESGYLNKLRLREWRELFEEAMPGCQFVVDQDDNEERQQLVDLMYTQGELLDYSREELLATNVRVFWRRPN